MSIYRYYDEDYWDGYYESQDKQGDEVDDCEDYPHTFDTREEDRGER